MTADEIAMQTLGTEAIMRDTGSVGGLLHSASHDNVQDERWYVVHTRPQAEIRAIENLGRQGYRTFCPRVRRTIRHARKTSTVMNPIFRNYLFVCLDISFDRWRCINSTRGVVSLIMQGDRPKPVPRGVIEAILQYVNADGTVSTARLFGIGQRVRIESGPLAEVVGRFERCEPDGRVCVLVELLGRVVSVVLNKETTIIAA
jgi:transcriptional antiterminator RfaH